MRDNLLRWQWDGYTPVHRDRGNLALHAVTVPIFHAGALLVLASPLIGLWGLGGVGAMGAVLVAQGRGHKRERTAGEPFLGPGDLITRLFAEQFVNFPRFVLSGGFRRAWRDQRAE